MLFAVVLGWLSCKKTGMPFAMITLGLGELIHAAALMVPELFGGEAGVTANRVVNTPMWESLTLNSFATNYFGLDLSYRQPIQVYYLIATYTLVCTACMHAYTRTPLGHLLNAVRSNAERVEFIGYSAQSVRFRTFTVAGFFAGVAGGLYALQFEIATPELLGSAHSGAYLLFTFVGGISVFWGPIIGAVLMVLSSVVLSEITPAWLLYLGLLFMLMVLYAPGGLASLVIKSLHLWSTRPWLRVLLIHVQLVLASVLISVGTAAMIEMLYRLQLNPALGYTLRFLNLTLNAHAALSWCGALAAVGLGCAVLKCWRFSSQQSPCQKSPN
jgi:branched-chain amino acid transport system permease protein